MLEKVVEFFPEQTEEEEEDDIPRVAIVGKPNVGKSSLINKLLAGTTDPAADVDGDGNVTIDDVVELINYLLTNQ